LNPYISGLETSLKLEHVGQKAYNLMVLIKEGIPVPPGCVITKQAHCYFQVNNSLPKELEAGLDKALLGFTSDLLIVRSSAIGEDSGTHSFAGQFDSFVCDNNKLSVTEALKKCWNSLSNDRAKAYQSAMGMELTEMGVV
jgi:phosphoenolpyruvate synthase/pyruvate phosphate dikinase